MEFTKQNLQELILKRDKYMATATKVYENGCDEQGKFKNIDVELDFNGLLNKINDTAIAIKNVAKIAAPDHDYIFITDRITGIEGLTVATETEKNTPVNRPVYTTLGGSSSQSNDTKGVCLTTESKKFANMFGGSKGRLNTGGFKNFNDYLEVVHSGRYDERLGSITNAMTEGTPSSGGFAVPEEFAAMLLDNSLESEIVRPRAQVWPMKSETRKIPGWDGTSHSSGLYGGLAGVWLGEGKTATRQDAKLRLMQLTANKLAIFSQASNELLADGTDFENQLGQVMVKSSGWSMDYAFFQGTGAGQPLGVLNDPALITIDKESGQSANTIIYQNVVNMFARLAPQCVNNSVWICNSTCIPQLLMMCLPIGVSGSYIPVLQESNGKFVLLTRPIIFTEKIPALSSKGDIILVDLSQYAVGLRKEVSIDKSNVPGWLEDSSDYRTIIRVDGRGTWKEPITPKHGDSLSWCVALEAR
jgi:HK97 family phage major capsid protein